MIDFARRQPGWGMSNHRRVPAVVAGFKISGELTGVALPRARAAPNLYCKLSKRTRGVLQNPLRCRSKPYGRSTLKRGMAAIEAWCTEMETPCINVCVIDTATRLCTGCRRSIDEISAWASLGSAERRRIMDGLAARTSTRSGYPRTPLCKGAS